MKQQALQKQILAPEIGYCSYVSQSQVLSQLFSLARSEKQQRHSRTTVLNLPTFVDRWGGSV